MEETRRERRPLGPLQPERPWPSPVPGVPIPTRRSGKDQTSKILDKLVDIERRLERIEKILTKRFGPSND